MKLYGLTGGIGSGKSTVSRMFRELGAEVLDADVIAREVVEPGTPGLAAVAERFPGVVGPEGRLDRAALGAGWRVLRYGWQEVVHRPDEVVRELRAHLGSAPSGPNR